VRVGTGPIELEWSNTFEAADWIRERLHPFAQDVGSVIPDAFDAYVAIAHPAGSDVLPVEELGHLAAVLSGRTATPDRVWYCVWDGYGHLHGSRAVSALRRGRWARREPDPPGLVPRLVREGGRLRLPQRDYFIYQGDRSGWRSLSPWVTPNIWFPEDRAWCVASEIDLVVTYVAGTPEAIGDLRSDAAFRTIAVTPTEPL